MNTVSGESVKRAEKPLKELDPECTVTHPVTGEFYDLRPLIRHKSDKSCVQEVANDRVDWAINGHDYGHNFTVNICEPVLADYSDVTGVTDRTNVSGFYVDGHGNKISIGFVHNIIVLRIVEQVGLHSSVDDDYCWSIKMARSVATETLEAP